jgi:hypothetical protein
MSDESKKDESKKKENWESVILEQGFKLANQGVVVVGGLQAPGGHGDVIAPIPEPR